LLDTKFSVNLDGSDNSVSTVDLPEAHEVLKKVQAATTKKKKLTSPQSTRQSLRKNKLRK